MATPVLHLYGQPGAGKTTIGFTVASNLMQRGLAVEHVHDVARVMHRENKDLNKEALQVLQRQRQLIDAAMKAEVDYVIDDGPLLGRLAFAIWTGDKKVETIAALDVRDRLAKETNAIHVLVIPNDDLKWNPAGREQIDEGQSRVVGAIVRDLLVRLHVPFITVKGQNSTSTQRLMDRVYDQLEKVVA